MYMQDIKFDIVLEKQKIGYTAYVPVLPGCISEGNTKKEARQNINEAIQLYLEEISQDKIKHLKNTVSIEKISVKQNA